MISIEDVWGIGRKLSKRLRDVGVGTAFDFTNLNDNWIHKNLSVVSLRLKLELQGTPTLKLNIPQPKKSISVTRSFEKNYKNYDELKERVSTFAVSCASKLREQKSMCSSLMVFIHTNGYRKDLVQYSKNFVMHLPYPTNSNIELSNFAINCLEKIYIEGYQYKKAGVIVMDLCKSSQHQYSIFENSNTKHKALMESIDNLDRKYGYGKVKLACQDYKKTWKMKQSRLSPCYTTRLNDIITVVV